MIQQFKPMSKVMFVSDTLGINLPVGQIGYVVKSEACVATALNHLVKVPEINIFFQAPACDLEEVGDEMTPYADQVDGLLLNLQIDIGDKEMFESLAAEQHVKNED